MDMLFEQAKGTSIMPLTKQMNYAVTAISSLLDSLLKVSRLDAGLVVPEPAEVAIDAIVERLADEYNAHGQARGLRVISRTQPTTVTTDPIILERILRNLLENAIRYTRTGGVIVRLTPGHSRIQLHITDTGIGIEKEHHDSIFDEFFQVDNVARDRTQGLGLGLSIVTRLCALLGYRISLKSKVGRGTRFTITIPLPAPSPPH
jgi:signal transduction histidine kinase